MSEPVLLEERDGALVTLTLNRPGARNALSSELRSALTERFTSLAGDAATEVVILTGAGPAFCAGLDLKELSGDSGETSRAVGGGADLVGAMNAFDRPIIGAINGFAITGGFEVALACDILIGSTEARFADTHARVGIMPGWGLSQKLSRLVGIQRAKLLSLTGNFLPAEQALAWGLLAEVVAPEALLPRAREIAADIQSCVPEVMRAYLGVIDAGFAESFGEGMRIESEAARRHAASVTKEQISERRQGIQERGRSQASGAAGKG
ncbi:MAG: enoyl-CoA hydratase [Myxococcota bacterium]|nr:enoyl-CoA hydratase [Myxococcota bacterium]